METKELYELQAAFKYVGTCLLDHQTEPELAGCTLLVLSRYLQQLLEKAENKAA